MFELETLEARLRETREQFLQLVEDIRPQLHKYCARMTRSVLDGEDLVQETLAQAYYQLPDGVSFRHVVHLASEEDKARLQPQPFFERFAGDIDARCDEEPTVTPLTLVAGTRA